MNVDAGHKVQIAVIMTRRLLERVDDVAKREAGDGDEPNRSKVIRRLVGEGLDRLDAEAGRDGAA
jgi:metal-responsive CopG/Arc/MetJ family transcriptional regulator